MKVDGRLVVNLARTLWADEGEPLKALHILNDGCGVPLGTAIEILCGLKTLKGVNTFSLEDDNTDTTEHGNSLAFEDVVGSLLERLHSLEERIKNYEQLMCDNTEMIASKFGRVEIPTRLYYKLQNGEVNMSDVEPFMRSCPGSIYPLRDSDMEQRINHGVNQLTNEKPKPGSLKSNNGWIAPNGDFYECGPAEHDMLAEKLGVSTEAVEKRYVRISKNTFSSWRSPIQFAGLRMTSKQKRTVMEWCELHHEKWKPDDSKVYWEQK